MSVVTAPAGPTSETPGAGPTAGHRRLAPAAARTATPIAAFLYVVLAAVKIAVHPMWRDELQSWTLARSSHSIGELIQRVRYEQHPPGWYLLLWIVSGATSDPRALQVVLVVLVAVMVWVVLRFAPFPRPIRWLILFGYFPLFEYSTLARPYILDLVFTLGAAELIRRRRTGLWFGVTVAGLLFFDNAYGSVLAAGLVVAAVARSGSSGGWRRAAKVAGGLGLFELVLLALERRPSNYAGPVLRLSRLAHLLSPRGFTALEQPAHALVPVPVPQLHFWNTFLIDRLSSGVVVLIAMVMVWALAWVLRRDRAALAMWLVGVGATVAFMDAANQSFARFSGTIFVALLAAFWIYDPPGRPARPVAAHVALIAVLVLQIPGAMVAAIIASTNPFSRAESAAGAVSSLPGTVVAGPDFSATPVAGYATRRVYLAQAGRYGTYTVWNSRLLCDGPCTWGDYQGETLRAAGRLAGHGPVFVVLDFPATPSASLTLCHAYTGAVVPDENYWVYAFDGTCA